MQTTSIYIELVIIGAEALTWIFTIFALIDARVISVLKNGLSSIPIAVILLGLCYVVGMVFDRIADWIFKKFEQKIRAKQEIPKNVIGHLLFVKTNDEQYFNYITSRKRIVRGTALNVLPISIALALYLLIHHLSTAVAVAIILCGVIFFILCLITYHQIIVSYYKRVKRYIAAEKKNTVVAASELQQKGRAPD